MSSFQCIFSNYENGKLPNNVIIHRNNEEDREVFGVRFGRAEDQTGRPTQAGGPHHPEFESASESRSKMH